MLRQYQHTSVDDSARLLNSGASVCLVSPTGSGKTVILANIASKYASVCWVAHRSELLSQADTALERWATRSRREVVTIQSLRKTEADLLVVDECHHYASDDWSKITTLVTHAHRIGATATPERSDGRALCGIFSDIVVAAKYSELISAGHIVPCKITAAELDSPDISCAPLRAYQEHAAGLRTIAFAPTIETAERWAREFCCAGIPSALITGETQNRADILSRFANGEFRVLWNVYVLTEGFDDPGIQCVILARKFGHVGQYIQATGRGLRPAPGKDCLRLIDLCGNWIEHGIPTEDRSYSLTGKPIRRSKVQRLRQCMGCGTVCVAWVGKCPECGYVAPRRKLPVRVGSEQLLEVYDGENTPVPYKDAELDRLRSIQRDRGYSLQWVCKEYRQQFGRNPVIRDADMSEIEGYRRYLIKSGRPYPQAYAITKRMFGL